jgi:hypothetical protein
MALNLTKNERKKIFHLPVEQAVFVPSTIYGDKTITKLQQRKRIKEVKKYLSEKFGGFTSVSAKGGYYSGDKNKIIQEDVAVVTSFSTNKAHKKGLPNLKKQLKKWKKKWHQESMGYSHEGDLYYFS